MVVTKPIGETGIPLPDTVINNLVCEIGEQQKPVSKVNFHKPTSGYSWKYQITIMFPPEHPFYNMSAQEQVEFITKNYPVDSSHLGVFDKMPADFKIGVWYSLYGLDEKDNGTYYFIFQNDFEHVKIVKAVGPF
ncbi:MAG TPA: hypothetical protein DCQ93_08760 [Bacteroidetes bacterium]|nr:hypothetical protein [Bacteroidota bacterium]